MQKFRPRIPRVRHQRCKRLPGRRLLRRDYRRKRNTCYILCRASMRRRRPGRGPAEAIRIKWICNARNSATTPLGHDGAHLGNQIMGLCSDTRRCAQAGALARCTSGRRCHLRPAPAGIYRPTNTSQRVMPELSLAFEAGHRPSSPRIYLRCVGLYQSQHFIRRHLFAAALKAVTRMFAGRFC
ncbi:MAG: hypothetical protein JWQ23_3083 [Herminiimonas sp.]|nr:hypothetical protein [Herminiimonas sp.]